MSFSIGDYPSPPPAKHHPTPPRVFENFNIQNNIGKGGGHKVVCVYPDENTLYASVVQDTDVVPNGRGHQFLREVLGLLNNDVQVSVGPWLTPGHVSGTMVILVRFQVPI